LGGKARLDGHRVSVFQIGEMYTVAGHDPEVIADQLSLSLAAVHAAFAYYYDHPDEMVATRERRNAIIESLDEESEAPEEAAR